MCINFALFRFAFPSFNLPSTLLVTNTSLLDQVSHKTRSLCLFWPYRNLPFCNENWEVLKKVKGTKELKGWISWIDLSPIYIALPTSPVIKLLLETGKQTFQYRGANFWRCWEFFNTIMELGVHLETSVGSVIYDDCCVRCVSCVSCSQLHWNCNSNIEWLLWYYNTRWGRKQQFV